MATISRDLMSQSGLGEITHVGTDPDYTGISLMTILKELGLQS